MSDQHTRRRRRRTTAALGRVTGSQTAVVRVAAGAVMLARARTVGQVLGAAPTSSGDADWAVRMLGGREVALGAGVLWGHGPVRRAFLLAGAVSDAVDAATLAGALRTGRLGRTRGTRLSAGLCALGAVAAAAVQVRDAVRSR